MNIYNTFSYADWAVIDILIKEGQIVIIKKPMLVKYKVY